MKIKIEDYFKWFQKTISAKLSKTRAEVQHK